jgi:hypothetical protein
MPVAFVSAEPDVNGPDAVVLVAVTSTPETTAEVALTTTVPEIEYAALVTAGRVKSTPITPVPAAAGVAAASRPPTTSAKAPRTR